MLCEEVPLKRRRDEDANGASADPSPDKQTRQ